jgi:hypothetical protein
MAYQQQRETLLPIAVQWLSANAVGLWGWNVPVVVPVYKNAPLLWPVFREIVESRGEVISRSGHPPRCSL